MGIKAKCSVFETSTRSVFMPIGGSSERLWQSKIALMKRYDLTEDGYCRKFKVSKPEADKSTEQFNVRLDRYLLRWLELSDTDQKFGSLKDLIVKEQFIYSCPKDLAIHRLSIISSSHLTNQLDQDHMWPFTWKGGLSEFLTMPIFTILAVKLLKNYWNVKFTASVKYFTSWKRSVTLKIFHTGK